MVLGVVTSRRRQHELLASWRTWALTSILLDPAEVARVRESGWSGTHHTDPISGERIVGTSAGLGFGVDGSWRNPREVIAWSDVEAIAKAVPVEVHDQLAALGEQLSEHRRTYPRFSASAAAIGCGPIIEGQPLTARQEAYLRELEDFEASGALPAWERQAAVLDARRFELHDRALAAGLDEVPADLFDLLEDQPPQRQDVRASAEPTAAERRTRGPEREEGGERIRNYTDHQRSALERLGLPEPFTVICERKSAHSSERVVFEYGEGDRFDSVILDVDDHARGYLDAGAAVLVARAHQRYESQARSTTYTDAARAMSGRAAACLGAWLETHTSLEVESWRAGQSPAAARVATGTRPAIAPPPIPSTGSNQELRAAAAATSQTPGLG